MDTTHDFLDLLGLDENARERDIRGAYARRLKRIDQAQDPDAFQRLRSAYETALDWAAWKAREQDAGADAPAAAADPAPPARAGSPAAQEAPREAPPDEAPSPGALAHAVFQRLADELPGLAARPGGRDDPAPWKEALLRRLDDEELVNIDARITFEAYVATILAQGWRPGHERLLVAAQDVFGWNVDRRALLQFGQAGALLDQALVERELFLALPVEQQRALRTTLDALREAEPPDARRVRAGMRNVDMLVQRFPALMRVVVSIENVEHWRSAYQSLAGQALEPEHELPPPPARGRGVLKTVGILLLTWVAFTVLSIVFNAFDGGKAPAPAPPVSREVLDTLIGPIEFKPSPEAKPGPLDTRVRVFLDQDRRVERVQNVSTSGEPAFDNAVDAAVRAARPFPPGTPREFELGFTARVTESMPREPVPPLDLKRLNLPPAGVAPGPALLEKHIPPIAYTPTRFAQPGKLSLRYQVFLDADGKVERFVQRQGSGEPRLDRAFEAALLAATPFPKTTARAFEVGWSTTITVGQRAAAPMRGQGQENDTDDAPPEQDGGTPAQPS